MWSIGGSSHTDEDDSDDVSDDRCELFCNAMGGVVDAMTPANRRCCSAPSGTGTDIRRTDELKNKQKYSLFVFHIQDLCTSTRCEYR